MSYSEYLKDPRWQKKRLEIFERDEWECRGCFDTTKTLHVHHTHYEKGLKPWEYENYSLITLCEDCHKRMRTRRLNSDDIIALECGYIKNGLMATTAVFSCNRNDNDIIVTFLDYKREYTIDAHKLMDIIIILMDR